MTQGCEEMCIFRIQILSMTLKQILETPSVDLKDLFWFHPHEQALVRENFSTTPPHPL